MIDIQNDLTISNPTVDGKIKQVCLDEIHKSLLKILDFNTLKVKEFLKYF